ncbi:hypothetical protein D1007_39401 [Hordeum vulgare]|nr:hypothetical protein D1007_39401 [Hordeum vulgare]
MGCGGSEEAIRPSLSPRIDAFFLREPREKEPVLSSSPPSSSPSHQPFRAPGARSHGRRLNLEQILVAEALFAGGLAGQRDLRRPHQALHHHRLLPPASQVLVRIRGAETAPTPVVGEVVVFNEHFYRGFGLPASAFFSEWLPFFGLQPHHLAPNALLHLSAFVVLCEGFVGIEPRIDLWRSLFFFKQQSIAMEKSEVEKLAGSRPMTPCGAAQICAYLEILEKEGFLGRDLLTTMVTCRILPLHRRPHLVCQMSGWHDPYKLSTKRFTPDAVARRVNLISTARMDDGGN